MRQAKYFQDPRLKDINDLLGDNRDNRDRDRDRDNRGSDRDSKPQAQGQGQAQQPPLSLSQTLTNVLSQKVGAGYHLRAMVYVMC